MNVLIVAGIFPPDIGGPASYVPLMSSELSKRGHKVSVITLSDSLENDDRSYSFSVLRIQRSIFKPWRFLLTMTAILREGRQAQVLYVNGLYLEAVVANIFLQKPLVEKIVGDWAWERATNKGWVTDSFEEFQERKQRLKVEFLRALRRFCTCRADAVIVPSQYLAWAVAGWGVPSTKTVVVYNAVDLSPVSPTAIPLSTRINVVTVGRLVAWKQVDRLIEAVGECKDMGLIIVGDGPERSRLEKLAHSLDVADRIHFAGQRSKAETLSLMAACDLFVLNSTYEGLPHVVLEAMSLGLPVVATAVGGTPEVVHDGENGVLLPPAANGFLSRALAKLISSSAERRRLAEGAKATLERFQLPGMVEATEAALRTRA